jgi:hypothetical protein
MPNGRERAVFALLVAFAAVVGLIGFVVGRRTAQTPEPEVRVVHRPPVARLNERRREISREAVKKTNAQRYRCGECDMETTPGPLARHQRRTGHEGRIRVDG